MNASDGDETGDDEGEGDSDGEGDDDDEDDYPYLFPWAALLTHKNWVKLFA